MIPSITRKRLVSERTFGQPPQDAQHEVVKDLKLVLDTGVATNPDSLLDTPPVYILGGLIGRLEKILTSVWVLKTV